MFVGFADLEGMPVWIDADVVIAVESIESEPNTSLICTSVGECFRVRGKPAYIVKHIEDARKQC